MGLQPAGRLEVRSLGSVLELAIGGALSVFRQEIQFARKKQKFNLQQGRFKRLQTRRTWIFKFNQWICKHYGWYRYESICLGSLGTKDQRVCHQARASICLNLPRPGPQNFWSWRSNSLGWVSDQLLDQTKVDGFPQKNGGHVFLKHLRWPLDHMVEMIRSWMIWGCPWP